MFLIVQLLQWLNNFLQTDYAKIEDCADGNKILQHDLIYKGVAYCQIFDALYPGTINLRRLNFNARYEDEYIRNLQLLQDLFKKKNIPKTVPSEFTKIIVDQITVNQLAKGKFQDNNEFLQWCYSYVQKMNPNVVTEYDALERRRQCLVEQLEKQKQLGKHSNQS